MSQIQRPRAKGDAETALADPSEHAIHKIERLRQGGRLRVLDLFGGCGGLSLGFQAAGMDVVANVELDPLAARSHALNFFRNAPPDIQELHSRARDITKTDPEPFAAELGLATPVERAIDVIIGGPPCQAFARVGRAKLREVAEHPEAFKQDPRANLYLRFLYYVEKFQPLAILMENVPDVINFGGHNIAEETCDALSPSYDAKYTLLNAAFYGVPQMRERMFLIAYARELHIPVAFPQPTHWVDLPRGYEGTRRVALKNLELGLLGDGSYYTPPPVNGAAKQAVTAEDALRDLPPITAHKEGKLKRGARRFTTAVPYGRKTPSEFGLLMRTWKGFEASDGIYDHVIRVQPRDYDLFSRMQPGHQYPEAYELACGMFEQELQKRSLAGDPLRPGSAEYRALKKKMVPPYDPHKFPNKWRKMEADRPARTLMAHLGKDGYSHIHYDSQQARTISVREAARLQSFPDGFVFSGTMNPAFRQIGNAVPPLMANALATAIKRAIVTALSAGAKPARSPARPGKAARAEA